MSESDYERTKSLTDSIRKSIATRKADFIIFVLGPGPSSPYYKARTKIRDTLRQEGFLQTFFPEEITSNIDIGGVVYIEDFLIKQKADLIIILPTSPGAQMELAIYSREKRVVSNLVVFVEEKYAEDFLKLMRTGTSPPTFLENLVSMLSLDNIALYPKEDLDKCEACSESEIIKQAVRLSERETLKEEIPSPF